MEITLKPELERWVHSFNDATPSEVVEQALEVMLKVMEGDQAERRRKIALSIAQLDRGEGKPWDVEEIKAEGRRLLEERQKQREASQPHVEHHSVA